MELDIRIGKRVLYKHNRQWYVGELTNKLSPAFTEKGLFLFIIPAEYIGHSDVPFLHDAEINDIFLESKPVEDWMRQYGYLMTKDEYINFINSEDFNKNIEHSYVSDGEYYYYNINKFNESWIRKQPFDYIVREE